MALVIGGGYAEYCVAHESHALSAAKLDPVHAAGIPETFFTVWHNVFERGGLQKGETLLVHGGTSGIGTTAIQLAKQFGARVIITAGSDDKCEAATKLGADVAVNYKTKDFVAETKAATNDKGADVILDMVGGDYIARNYEAAAVEGRIVQIAFQGSPESHRRFPPHHAQAAAPYRLDVALPLDRGQRRDRERHCAKGAAADRGRNGKADHQLHLSAQGRIQGPRAHGNPAPTSARSSLQSERFGAIFTIIGRSSALRAAIPAQCRG